MQITRGNFVSVANSYGITSNTAVVVNAATYGARADNLTDNTVAINNALVAAVAAGGGVVTLGPGVYRHMGVVIPAGVTLRGAGHGGTTTLRNTHATNHSVSFTGTPGGPYLNGAHLSDVTLDATAVRGSQAGVNALLAQAFTVDRVDVKSHGVGVLHKASWECLYNDVHVQGCTIGWYFPGPAPYTPSCPITVTASHAVECGQALRIDDGVEGLTWTGGDFTGATVASMVILGNSTSQLTFTGINFEGGAGDDIYFGNETTGPTQVTFYGCRFFQGTTKARSIWFQRGDGLAFVGCKFTGHTKVMRQESTTGTATFVGSNGSGYTTFVDLNGTTSDVAAILVSSSANGLAGIGPGANENPNTTKAAQWAATRVVYGNGKIQLVDADFTTTPVEGSMAAAYNLTDNSMRWGVRHYDSWLMSPPLGVPMATLAQLSTPSINYITDTNAIPALLITPTPSAVNYLQLLNAATGAGPVLVPNGNDTNVDLNLAGKGTGKVKVNGGVAATVVPGFTTTATAAGTTTLTYDSNAVQVFTGTLGQTVVLPTTGVAAGQQFTIINNSTASITVQPSGGGTLKTVSAGGGMVATTLIAAPTTTTDWFVAYGTGASPSQTATSSAIAQRDSRGNLLADMFIPSALSVVTAGAVSTQTIDSNEVVIYTGTLTQTHKLATTSVTAGYRQTVLNQSTGAVNVQSSDGTGLITLQQSQSGVFTAMQATPVSNTHWATQFSGPLAASTGNAGNSLAQRTSIGALNATVMVPGFTTTATAAGTTTLTNASTGIQEFTGTLAQTITLPTTGISTGWQITVTNSSSGTLTINSSSGGALGATVGSGQTMVVTALVATPTTAAHWGLQYIGNLPHRTNAGVNTVAQRDSSANLLANNFLANATTTTSSAAAIALLPSSASMQIITGSTNQTITLPSNAPVGLSYLIICEGTTSITVNASGGSAVIVFGGAAGNAALLVAKNANGTTPADWVKYVYDGLTRTSSPNASTVAVRDANAIIAARAFAPSLSTTATAATTTALTVASTEVQVFTGSTTQTVTLPTTGIAAGQRFSMINTSTGAVTVNSSGGNLVKTVAAGAASEVTALVATPTTAAHWFAT